MWIYWCLLSTIISGFTAVALKKCSKNDSKRMAIMGLFSYHLMMLVISVGMKPEFILAFNLRDMLEMFLGLMMQSIGLFCALACVKYGKVSITTPIKKCNTIVIFVLGVVVLKEDFTIWQIVISIVLFLLSIKIAKQEDSGTLLDKKKEKAAVLFAYGYVFCNGISKVLNKVYITQFEDPLYVVFNYAVMAIVGVLIYCALTKSWEYLDFRKIDAKKYFVAQSLCDVTSSIFNRFAMLDGDVSVIGVIETSSVVITILASRWLLKEKVSLKKYGMIFGVFVCVFLLAIIK